MAQHKYDPTRECSRDLLRHRSTKRSLEHVVEKLGVRSSSSVFSTPSSPPSCRRSNKRPRQHQKRSVRFVSPAATAFVPPLVEHLTQDLARAIWYQQSEIATLKSTVRRLIIQGKRCESDDLSGLERFNMERSNHKRQAIRCILLASRHNPRADTKRSGYSSCGSNARWNHGTSPGLLPVDSPCWRPAAPKPLLHRQVRRHPWGHGDESAEFVRTVSQRCTAVSTELARTQAFQDFCQVYDPLRSLLGASDTITNYNDYFFNDDGEGDPVPPKNPVRTNPAPRHPAKPGSLAVPRVEPDLFRLDTDGSDSQRSVSGRRRVQAFEMQ